MASSKNTKKVTTTSSKAAGVSTVQNPYRPTSTTTTSSKAVGNTTATKAGNSAGSFYSVKAADNIANNNNVADSTTNSIKDIADGLLTSIQNGTLSSNENANKWNSYGWLDDVFWYDDGTGITNINKNTGELLAKYDKSGTFAMGDSVYDNREDYVSYGDPNPNVSAAEDYLSQQMGTGSTKSQLLDQIMNEYLNREKFSYDPSSDTLFQNNLSNAMRAGQSAMQDTMGQAAALTGGYGSSYATSAANQAYNSMIDDAYNNITDYYNMALSQYNLEGEQLMNEYNMVAEQENNEYLRNYQKERDARADYESDRNFDYQQKRDEISDARWEEQWDYQKVRDAISDERYTAEQNTEADRWSQEMAYKIQQGQISQEQFDAELAEKKREFDLNYGVSSYKAYNSGSSGSGSGSGSGTSSSGKSNYTSTQLANVKKEALKQYNNGGDDALDNYIASEGDAKGFLQEEIDAIYEYAKSYGKYDAEAAAAEKAAEEQKTQEELKAHKQEVLTGATTKANTYKKLGTGKLLSTTDYQTYTVQQVLDAYKTELNNDKQLDDDAKAQAYSAFESRIKRMMQS